MSNILKITYTTGSFPNVKDFTQTIGDIPNEAVSGIVTRINQINTLLGTVTNQTVLNTADNPTKYAVAIKYVLASETMDSSASVTRRLVNKITAAELISQESVRIYDYAQ